MRKMATVHLRQSATSDFDSYNVPYLENEDKKKKIAFHIGCHLHKSYTADRTETCRPKPRKMFFANVQLFRGYCPMDILNWTRGKLS